MPIVLTILVGGAVAAWLLRGEPARVAPTTAFEEGASAAGEQGVPALSSEGWVADSTPRRAAVEAPAPAAATVEKEAAPAENSAVLAVRVVDRRQRAPLARVRVTVLPKAGGSSGSTHIEGTRGTLETSPITDADGRVEFDLPAGIELALTANGGENAGYENQDAPALTPGERREIEIALPSGDDLVFCARVLSQEDRSPVEGARAQLVRAQQSFHESEGEHWQSWEEDVLAELVTDHEGFFQLSLPSWRKPDLRIVASGFAPVFLHPERGHETRDTAQEVLLARAATLHARLLDTRGAAVAKASVRLWTEAYNLRVSSLPTYYLPSLPDLEWKTNADFNGSCVLQDLPPGVPFHVEIRRSGRESVVELPPVSLNAGEVREVEWRLGADCLVEGLVVDQHDESVARRKIWMQRAWFASPTYFDTYNGGKVVLECTTDAQGRFAFRDVPSGTWWIGPAAEREDRKAFDLQAIAPYAQVIEVVEGMPRQEVTLRVHRGLYIRGRVVGPDGEPARNAYVSGRETLTLMARLAPDGSFAFGPLVPGPYTIVASGWEMADSVPVEAMAGEEGIVLSLRAGGTVSGYVVDGETGERYKTEITLARPENEGGMMTTTGDDGSFRVKGVMPGNYVLVASGAQRVGMLRNVSVVAGVVTDGLVVTIAPGAWLRVKFAGKGYLEYGVRCDGAPIAFDAIQAGGQAEVSLSPGHFVLDCKWGKQTATRELDLAAGEVRELVFGGD